jgi:hypothetical protein
MAIDRNQMFVVRFMYLRGLRRLGHHDRPWLLVAHQRYGDGRRLHHLLGVAAQGHPSQPSPSVRTHNDEIRMNLRGSRNG